MSDEDKLNFMIKRAEDSIKFHSSLPPRPIFRRPSVDTQYPKTTPIEEATISDFTVLEAP